MTGTHQQPPTNPVSSASPGPDNNTSDGVLVAELQGDLMMVEQSPQNQPSPWAAAFGTRPSDLQFGAVGTTSNTGGGYRVTPDQLQSWINRLQDIADRMATDRTKINRVKAATPPAPDAGSTMQAARTSNSGSALQDSYAAWISHASRQLANWEAALANYRGTEQATANGIRRLADQA